MSPRSAEFLDAARRKLAAARGALDSDPSTTVSAAYYAMLYAARAALSERESYAKTHSGTWHLFREEFVAAGSFDADLTRRAQGVQPERERADYDAWVAPVDEADNTLVLAERFVNAVAAMLDG